MTNEQIVNLLAAGNMREQAARLMDEAKRLENEALGIVEKPELRVVK